MSRSFAFINGSRCYVDLTVVASPRLLNSEVCPVCLTDVEKRVRYVASMDCLECGECGERFAIHEEG
jgi:ferredoxin-like protein FixX